MVRVTVGCQVVRKKEGELQRKWQEKKGIFSCWRKRCLLFVES